MKIDEPMPVGIEAEYGHEEFTAFYRREFFPMVSIASSIVGDMSAGEDIAQEAFHRASERWDSVSSFDKPGTWVRRVVINLALNRKRGLAREAAALLRLAPSRQHEPIFLRLDARWLDFLAKEPLTNLKPNSPSQGRKRHDSQPTNATGIQ